MHIEPGTLASSKLMIASVVATGLLATHAPALLTQPRMWLRTALAAAFFSLFMQAFHLPVGPSELHFVGAMPIYLAFGLLPTLFGFGLGLLMQGLLFEPADLVHLSVNFLSLAVPLLMVHLTRSPSAAQPTWTDVLKLDARYYAGVTSMVGFWLAIGEVATPVHEWLRFAASYAAVVALEPVVTLAVLASIRRVGHRRWAAACFAPLAVR
ncbi:energy-coupling factor ABC transporter permease [Caldimonas brevitalea]|uniref:Cobalamin biosynthesis protein CbiM n=1 Tax=Caldimonas brevitalea TaxID=413882 RepID=A0A0G3BD03_9BURK|nr:energy-coupling factor ABC transporter permease [Caldimonas brevitalea]AKJ27227.1 cobalamin biosynthesis protein CbiM [Caldimonas brevitalea]